MKLDEYRAKIQKIDNDLMLLVKARLEISKEIGKHKKANNMAVFDANREREMFVNYKKVYNDNKTWDYFKQIFDIILITSKCIQNE